MLLLAVGPVVGVMLLKLANVSFPSKVVIVNEANGPIICIGRSVFNVSIEPLIFVAISNLGLSLVVL